MAKIVVAIPYYESDPGKRNVLNMCLGSLRGQDEILVLAGKQDSLPKAWNMCLDMGFDMGADYVILSNDDIILDQGNLADLCRDGAVVSPLVNGSVFKVFHAHMFAMPKEVYEKIGGFDERFKIYWSDTDYAVKLKAAGIPVYINEAVKVLHPQPGRTLQQYKGSTEESDRDLFVKIHGREIFDPITEL